MAARGVLILLDTLTDKTVTDDDRVDALLTLTDRLRTVEVDEQVFIDKVYQLFECCQTYLSGSNVELKLACLQTLGYCVYHEKLVGAVPVKLLHDVIDLLLKTIVTSTEKNMLTKALWVLAQQNFPSAVVESKVVTVMDALENIACRGEQYAGVQYEVSKILGRLQAQAPGVVAQHVVQWLRLILPLVVHPAAKLRQRAFTVLEVSLPMLAQQPDTVAALVTNKLEKTLLNEMKKISDTQYMLSVWSMMVTFLGTELHKKGKLVNPLLQLVESAFRSPALSIKTAAFNSWKVLIDNFAMNPGCNDFTILAFAIRFSAKLYYENMEKPNE
uniref:telomere-associated protein RIF1-like n=1 Tax=Myxine glutinosa TaxID=7769 RepID=UPI00358E3D84